MRKVISKDGTPIAFDQSGQGPAIILVAGALGLFGIAQIAGQISWILFLVGIVLLVIHMVSGRRVPIR